MGSRIPTEGNRAARQNAWRDVNANIAVLADRLTSAVEDADRRWTFMCECGGCDCREMIAIELAAYRGARDHDRLIVAPGHEAASGRVVERREDYVVVELA